MVRIKVKDLITNEEYYKYYISKYFAVKAMKKIKKCKWLQLTEHMVLVKNME